MRASSVTVDIEPQRIETHDEYVRERPYRDSQLCSQCNRGHMHRAHRHSGVDFLVSLVGIFPTVCSYCHSHGQRLEPFRLVAVLTAAMLALVWYIAQGISLEKSLSPPVQVVNATAHHGTPTPSSRSQVDER